MNRAKLVLASAIAVAIGTAQAYTLDTDAEKVGYTIGADMGSTLGEFAGNGDNISMDALIVGLRDAYQGNELSMTAEEMDATMQAFAEKRMKELEQEQTKQAEENLKKGQDFLKENANKEGIETTDSGLQYEVLEKGEGKKPSADSNVTVNYEGRLIDGTVFDSSEKVGEPVTFDINAVIEGWIEGLQLMNEGSKYRFFIPADLAYGEMGAGPSVPPNSTLIFDVELLKINDDASDSADQEAESTEAAVATQADEDVVKALEEAKANAEQAEQDAKKIAEEVQKEAKAADEEMAVEVEKAKADAQQAVENVERENDADTKAKMAEESDQQAESMESKVEDTDATSNNVEGEKVEEAAEATSETMSEAVDSTTDTENK